MNGAVYGPLFKGDPSPFCLHVGSYTSSPAGVPCKVALPLLRSSSSFLSGSSSYALQPCSHSRALKMHQPAGSNVIKAAFIFEWIGNLFRYLARAPLKLLAQKVEDDINRASKMVKTGALLVAKVAKEADEFAEEVERIAERTEEIAEKVAQATETIEERIVEVLDVIEGEKKLVITSYKLVDNEDQAEVQAEVKTTTVTKDDKQINISIETSSANEHNKS